MRCPVPPPAPRAYGAHGVSAVTAVLTAVVLLLCVVPVAAATQIRGAQDERIAAPRLVRCVPERELPCLGLSWEFREGDGVGAEAEELTRWTGTFGSFSLEPVRIHAVSARPSRVELLWAIRGAERGWLGVPGELPIRIRFAAAAGPVEGTRSWRAPLYVAPAFERLADAPPAAEARRWHAEPAEPRIGRRTWIGLFLGALLALLGLLFPRALWQDGLDEDGPGGEGVGRWPAGRVISVRGASPSGGGTPERPAREAPPRRPADVTSRPRPESWRTGPGGGAAARAR